MAANEILKRRAAQQSLIAFTEYTSPEYEAADHHREIAESLEAVERGELDRLMIFEPPRHGKSELCTRRFPAWFIGRNSNKQVISATYSGELATDFGRDVRNIIATQEYLNVFPDVELKQDSKAANRWHTNNGGIYVAIGRGGSATGRGAHILCLDDLFKDRQEADSPTIRESAWAWYTSTARTRLMPGGSIIYTTTRWHEDDPAGRILNGKRSGDWHVISKPAINENHEALWPAWFPLSELEKIRDEISPRDWSALYQQNPTPDEGSFFKKEWFWRYEPDEVRGVRKYFSSDFAVTESTDADSTELAVHGTAQKDGKLQVYACMDGWGGQTAPDTWIDEYINLCLKHKPSAEFNEAGVIRRAIEGFLNRRRHERRCFGRTEWIAPIANKEARARALQGMASMNMIGLPNNDYGERVLNDLLKFPAGVDDHTVDMLSIFAQAIDQAHPAIGQVNKPLVKRDRWDDAFENTEELDSWRI